MAGHADETLDRRDWMDTKSVRRVVAALSEGGADIRFVGGCVRDAVLGRAVNDVDLATPDLPETVTALAEAAGLKVVPTGLDHGTVTVVADGHPFEVTTLREDVSTDGRRAVVEFTDDWEHDAARRDFTMNAMSCRPDGQLFDYFGGLADARAGRVRFVGDADRRLREDVLRLLRFYRFHAWYGRGDADLAARAACRSHAPRLPGLSIERVRDELLRLLRAPSPGPTLEMMAADGALAAALPEAEIPEGVDRLEAVCARDGQGGGDPALRRLAALLPRGGDGRALGKRLRLSNRQTAHLAAVCEAAPGLNLSGGPRQSRQDIYRWGAEVFTDAALVAAGADGGDPAPALGIAADWSPPTLPVAGADLVAAGMQEGPAVGDLLRRLEAWWIDEDFAPDRAQLLARAAEWWTGERE